jgi:hypothetical protein
MPEAPVVNTPAASTSVPDLGNSLLQPGAGVAPAPVMNSVAQPNLTQGGAAAYGEPGAASQPSTVVPAGAPVAQPAVPPKHSHLLAMVQGLADGLSAASKSIATHGREGGAAEVQELQQGRAAAQQRAVAATQAQTDAQLRNALTTAQTNEINQKNHSATAMLADEIAQAHLKTTGEQQTQDITGADFQAAHGGMKPAEFSKQMDNTTPLTEQGNSVNPFFLQQGQSILRAADTAKIPSTNPAYQNLKAVLAPDSKATARDVYTATTQMQAEQERQGKAQDAAVKSQTGAQGAIKTQQEQLAQDTFNRTVPKNAAGQPTEDFATWQARTTKAAEVAAQQGDPTQLGEMAADGLLTIPQIAMSRQLDKPGFQKLIAAADAKAKANGQPEITVNGKGTGHYFNANAATQQYDYVKAFNAPGSKTQQSINSGSTFMEHMSDLLDVNAKYARTQATFLNTPLNKVEKAFGGTTYTDLLAALAPVKTEYDNALKAGFAPTAEDSATVDLLLKPNSTPQQLEDAGKIMAHTILRRLDSTNQGYKTHSGGVDYPNMLTPDAAAALQKMGIPTGGLQSGGSFGGTQQAGVNAGKTQAPQIAPEGHQITLAGGGTATKKNGQWVNDQTGQQVK